METWHVYQLRSDTDLLYVGYTRQLLKRRLGSHRRTKSWWPEVTGVRSEEFATEDEARQREKELWADGRPKHNKYSPFRTAKERNAENRRRVRAWNDANPERKRAQNARWEASPGGKAYRREWQRRHQPTTVAGRRARGKRWQQSGPGLF